MKTINLKQKKSRSELYLEGAMKNMRAVLPDLTMEQFAMQNLQTLFGLEREEYLEKTVADKGNGYYSRSLQSLLKNDITIKRAANARGRFRPDRAPAVQDEPGPSQ